MVRRVTAAATLATFVVALLLPSLATTHAWNDPDLAEGVSFRRAGSPESAVGQASRVETADHCAICHWVRSLGQSTVAAGQPVPTLAPAAGVPGIVPASPVATCGAGCPARAPPTLHV